MKLDYAQRLATRIRDELAPFCVQIEIAGSIRRQRPNVGDIDLVCLPRGAEGQRDLISRCTRSGRCVKAGEQYRVFTLQNDVQLDVWFAHGPDTDLLGQTTPENFSTLFVCRTGSAAFNIYLAQRAKERGLHWNPHAGLMRVKGGAFVDYRDGEGRRRGTVAPIGDYITTPTEAAFFDALGMDFVKPEERER